MANWTSLRPIIKFAFLTPFLFLFLSNKTPSRVESGSISITRRHGFIRPTSRHILELSPATNGSSGGIPNPNSSTSCEMVASVQGYESQCAYIRSHEACQSDSMIKYLDLYYCTFGRVKIVGAIFLALWLLSLFFALGNTAADYFCPSLEELSRLLHLAPTVAGVTLLPLGNGAPDVFASIASFVGTGEGQVGLNSVLGSGFFVTAVVAGSVCLVVSSAANRDIIQLDRLSFVRDIGFYLVTLLLLLFIMSVGSISFISAMAFLSLYLLYGIAVAASEISRSTSSSPTIPLHPINEESAWLYDSLLEGPDSHPGPNLPQWHSSIYSGRTHSPKGDHRPLWGWMEDEDPTLAPSQFPPLCSIHGCFTYFVLLPVMLPRRVTIPSRQKETWFKPYAVASAGLSPLLCAWVLFEESSLEPYLWAALIGVLLCITALATTDSHAPPVRYALPWVLGGFIMSVVWFYMIANELVSALVATGVMLGVDSSLLGLTVLAWGNSIGDAVSNLAMAVSGSKDSIQVAWSGCYAGPLFNSLVGLGASLCLASWKTYPAAFELPKDSTLTFTVALLVVGLLYSLCLMLGHGMKFSRSQGVGLIIIYVSFMTMRMAHVVGLVHLPWLD